MESTSFGVGLAPAARHQKSAQVPKSAILTTPTKKPKTVSLAVEIDEEPLELALGEVDVKPGDTYILDQSNGQHRKSGAVLSRSEEFENFKKGKGAELSKMLAENKCTLR